MAKINLQDGELARMQITKEQEVEISKLYHQTYLDLKKEMEKLSHSGTTSESLRKTYLNKLVKQLKEAYKSNGEELEKQIQKGMLDTAQAVVDNNSDWLKKAGGAKALFDYMARCQSLLQRGLPAQEQLPSMKVMKTYRRIDGDTDIIFICNPTETQATETMDVKGIAKGRRAEIWNPYNLETDILSESDSLLRIEGLGSRFLILSNEERPTEVNDSLSALLTDNAGKETIMQLDSEWDITFPNKWYYYQKMV